MKQFNNICLRSRQTSRFRRLNGEKKNSHSLICLQELAASDWRFRVWAENVFLVPSMINMHSKLIKQTLAKFLLAILLRMKPKVLSPKNLICYVEVFPASHFQ